MELYNKNEYEGNSYKSRKEEINKDQVEDRKKVEKVVSGPVKTKKKSKISKFFGNLVSDDPTSIKSFIVKDVVIPSIKKAISETIDVILYGDSRRSKTNASKISYRSFYDEPRTTREINQPRLPFNYDDIVFSSYGEADIVLSTLDDLITTYGSARVADLYDAVGLSCEYTANNYEWKNLRNAEVIRTRDGFALKLPRPTPIR